MQRALPTKTRRRCKSSSGSSFWKDTTAIPTLFQFLSISITLRSECNPIIAFGHCIWPHQTPHHNFEGRCFRGTCGSLLWMMIKSHCRPCPIWSSTTLRMSVLVQLMLSFVETTAAGVFWGLDCTWKALVCLLPSDQCHLSDAKHQVLFTNVIPNHCRQGGESSCFGVVANHCWCIPHQILALWSFGVSVTSLQLWVPLFHTDWSCHF